LITEPIEQDFRGLWGGLKYVWTGGNIDGYHYNLEGKATGLAPMMGMPPDIGMGKIVKAPSTIKKTIVIGEDMFNRVIPYSHKYGFKYFKPRGTNSANWMRNQVQWIRQQIQAPGTRIIDIGPKGPAPSSPYYMKELEMLKKYGF
jgi:hypothetical protein